MPWLYLKGISTGDFGEALVTLLGPDAPSLSATTITRLKATWVEDYEHGQGWDLSTRRYVYFWVDGVYFQRRLDHDRQCLLVIIGTDEIGNNAVVGLSEGYRESTQSWLELLLDFKGRGLTVPPNLAVGDGALDFWMARHHQLSGVARSPEPQIGAIFPTWDISIARMMELLSYTIRCHFCTQMI